MSSDFGYVNARVRGMSSRLMGDDAFGSALAAPDFEAFTGLLASSPYASAFEEARSEYDGLRAVDRALANAFRATTRKMLAFADGAPGTMIAVLLRRNDVEDLKTVARLQHAKAQGQSPSDGLSDAIAGLGELRSSVLEAMASAADLPSAAQALGVTKHPLSSAFTRAARAYVQDGDLFAFEIALDRAAFADLVEQSKRIGLRALTSYVQREIDAANLRTALKLAGRDQSAKGMFLPGGREVNTELFDQIVASGVEGLQRLRGVTFAEVARASDAAEAEQAIRAALDAGVRRGASGDPLGAGIVIRYLRERATEAAKLRLLARGSYYRVPRAQIEKELGHA